MEIVIVTGMSGAGKSKVADALEDIGFFCVDNIPPDLVEKFIVLCAQTDSVERIAIITDARGGTSVEKLEGTLDNLRQAGLSYRLLYLDCEEQILINRYKETRRKHPLLEMAGGSLEEAIAMEGRLMSQLHQSADIVIDSSMLSPTQLRANVQGIFLEEGQQSMFINCMSFGFKYGIPLEADLVFDVRCLPNPFYISELKPQTGLNAAVRDYVLSFEEAQIFLEKIEDLLTFSLPFYEKEGKTQLVIAFGCTGGKHRSVTFAEMMTQYLNQEGYQAITTHRDITRDVIKGS